MSTTRGVAPTTGPHGILPHDGEIKRAEQIVREIDDEIVAAGWPIGHVIGSEAQLMERFKTSRSVLREAARLLEHQTVATMRRGPSGGLVVREPNSRAAITATTLYLEYVGVTVADIIDARAILEPLAARWAAESMSEDAIPELRSALATADRLAAGASVHTAIAHLSGNPVLELFIEVLARLTEHYAKVASNVDSEERKNVFEDVGHTHRSIADAIIAGNAAQAEHRTEVHIAAMSAWLTGKYDGADTARQALARARLRTAPPRESGTKLAEHVSLQIRDQMIRSGVLPGELVGSESELLHAAGVSRAVFREGVRLLEHHGIVRMRRGPGGGLFATVPDPTACAESMALLLDYRQVTGDQVLAVRDALELACVVHVAHRAGDPEIAEWLEEARRNDEAVLATGHVAKVAHALHEGLAEVSGNPLLAMFVQILTLLYWRHTDSDKPRAFTDPIRTDVRTAHAGIIAAIAAGDAGLARHRMMRHLGAVSRWWS